MSIRRFSGLFIALLLLVGFFITAVTIAPFIPPLRDFDQTFYPAANYVLTGEDPYTGNYIESGQGAPPDFFSPPWVLPILLPFGLFTIEIARTLWMLFLVGIIFLSIVLLLEWGLQSRWLYLLLALPWSLITILYGQVTAFVLLGTIIVVPEVNKLERTHKSGLIILFSLLLLGIKPQLGVLIVIPLVAQLLWLRDRRLILISVAGLAILFISMMVTPSPLWLIAKSAEVQKIAPHWTSTLERELTFLQFPSWLATFVRLLVALVMGLWAWRERRLSPAWWSVCLVGGRSHCYPLLTGL